MDEPAPESTIAASRVSVADAAVLVALVLMTMGWFSFLVFPTYTVGLAILLALGLPGLFILVLQAVRRDRAALAGCVLAGWTGLAALLSGAPTLALRGSAGREASGAIVIGLIGVWATASTCSFRFRAAVPYLLLGLLGVGGVLGVLQAVVARDSGLLALQFGRAKGFTSNPVFFGGLMAGGASLSAVVGHVRPTVRLALPAFFAGCIELSGSRVATLAALTVLVAIAIAAARARVRLAERAGALAVFVAATALTSFAARWLPDVESSVERGTGDGGGRLSAWRYGFEAVLDRPVAGWGFGRFRAATQERFSAEFVRTAASDDLRQAWFDGHNLVLDLAVAVGLVGMCLVIWFIFEVWRRTSWSGRVFASTLAVTWLAQPAGLSTLVVVVLFVGATTAWTHEEAADESPASVDDRPGRGGRAVAIGTAAAAAVGTCLALFGVMADARLNRAIESGDPVLMERAARWYPDDSVVADVVAQAWFLQAQFDRAAADEALDWSTRAVEAEPDRPLMWWRLALRQAVLGDEPAALTSIESALELQPWHYSSWLLAYEISLETEDSALEARTVEALCALGEPLDDCSELTADGDDQPEP